MPLARQFLQTAPGQAKVNCEPKTSTMPSRAEAPTYQLWLIQHKVSAPGHQPCATKRRGRTAVYMLRAGGMLYSTLCVIVSSCPSSRELVAGELTQYAATRHASRCTGCAVPLLEHAGSTTHL